MAADGTVARRLWIRDPLAILADGAGGGVVVEGSRIAERVPAGGQPSAPVDPASPGSPPAGSRSSPSTPRGSTASPTG